MTHQIGDIITFKLRTRRSARVATPAQLGGQPGRPKKLALLRGKIRALISETTPNGVYHFVRVTYVKHDFVVPIQNIIPKEQVAEVASRLRLPIP